MRFPPTGPHLAFVLLALSVPAAAAPPTTPSAPVAGDAKQEPFLLETVTASFFSRLESRTNYAGLGVVTPRSEEGDATFFRARMGFQTRRVDFGDGLFGAALLEPQASGVWGATGTTTEPRLGIFQAYLTLGGDRFSFEAGRFRLHYGDGIVLGDPNWRETGRAYDGARAKLRLGPAYVDGFATATAPRGATPAEGLGLASGGLFAGDSYLWGFYAGLGELVRPGFEFDAYLIGVSQARADSTPSDLSNPDSPTLRRGGATGLTIGARAKEKIGRFDYRLEAGFQTGGRLGSDGRASSVLAYQATGELGFELFRKLRAGLEAGLASGDDPATAAREDWDALHPNGHRWLGLMDIIGARTNIETLVLRLSSPLGERFTVLADGHLFARLRPGGFGQVGDSRFAGAEIDTQILYQLGKPAHLRGLFATFLPGSGHYASNDPAYYVEAEVNVRF